MNPDSKPSKSRGPRLNIWLSQEDKTTIEDRARRANLSVTDYVVGAALNRELPAPRRADGVALPELAELQKIGINLNQAVRWSHQHQTWNPEIEALIVAIKALLHVHQG